MSAPSVRIAWRPVNSSELSTQEFIPPEGWFVDEVLPAFASNGAGVVFVMRPLEIATKGLNELNVVGTVTCRADGSLYWDLPRNLDPGHYEVVYKSDAP